MKHELLENEILISVRTVEGGIFDEYGERKSQYPIPVANKQLFIAIHENNIWLEMPGTVGFSLDKDIIKILMSKLIPEDEIQRVRIVNNVTKVITDCANATTSVIFKGDNRKYICDKIAELETLLDNEKYVDAAALHTEIVSKIEQYNLENDFEFSDKHLKIKYKHK